MMRLVIFLILAVRPSLCIVTVISGYIIDNKCWNRPNHIGIDGTNLETNPGGHILHCLYCCGCPASGYAILEETTSSVYGIKYQLDSVGNDLMYQLSIDEKNRGGDRAFNEIITVEGSVTSSGGTPVIAVKSLRFVPTVSNAGNIEICHGDCSATTSTSMGSAQTTTVGSSATTHTSISVKSQSSLASTRISTTTISSQSNSASFSSATSASIALVVSQTSISATTSTGITVTSTEDTTASSESIGTATSTSASGAHSTTPLDVTATTMSSATNVSAGDSFRTVTQSSHVAKRSAPMLFASLLIVFIII